MHRAQGFFPIDAKSVETALNELDAHLTLRTFLVGYQLTAADVAVWGAIRGNKIAYNAVKKASLVNFTRWYKFIEETYPWVPHTIQQANALALAKKAAKSAEGASYNIALPETQNGVVTRFPPEPSWVRLGPRAFD